MARQLTLATLRSMVLDRYDLPTATSTTWANSTLLTREINSSLQSYYALLMDCYPDDYFADYRDLTTSDSVDTNSLPTDFYRIINLVWLRGTDDVIQIEPGTPRDISYSGLTPQSWDNIQPRYRLYGVSAIRWLPTPSTSYTVRLTYVALPTDLSADGDLFPAGPGWEQYLVNDVCVKLAIREERDPSVYMAERDRWEMRIRDQAPLRGDTTGSLFMDHTNENLSDWELKNRLTLKGY